MAETTTKTIILPNEQEVTVERKIHEYYVAVDRNICRLTVWNWYNGKNVKTEWYNFPISEVADDSTPEGTFWEVNRDKLWEKINEIDAMPNSSFEEQRAKSERYGNGWNIRE